MGFWEIFFLCVGGLGQALFTARMLVQWWYSRKAGKSVAPPLFWWLSLVGSLLSLFYALFRKDPVFALAPASNLFFYARNILLSSPDRKGLPPRVLLLFGILFGALVCVTVWAKFRLDLLSEIPPFWLGVGLTGSTLWVARFLLQWILSERKGESHLPLHFWLVSLGGAALLFAYSLFRKDPVFLVGYSFPIPLILWNLLLFRRSETQGDGERAEEGG